MKPRDLSRQMSAEVRRGLAERSFAPPRGDDPFTKELTGRPPLQARLFVTVEVDRYGDVRVAGLGELVCPWVEELLGSVPPAALSPVQEINAGGLSFALARETFGAMDEVEHRSPLAWRAESPEQGEEAVAQFLAFVDGPVARWIEARSGSDALRADVAPGRPGADDGALVRAVATLDAVLGDLPSARQRLQVYAVHPQRHDTAERVQAFERWLESVEPRDG
ncbi:hypothetical protein [Blastococcus xanthinilyticus]|uniref:Uncharacterized protein n=1 Tax=Blastococcus xanthinilyticus TaxID=1564164 RepID=A0A5S5CVK1_9ACTN|nr:hypothetical protein [Blastococcus xanthinilyticus]TYP86856.1 hypothetical protein BD833_108141 [Blastococcus xanthinilyticus]